MKVIDWTHWDNDNYREPEDYYEAEVAVVSEIKKRGIYFDADYHQRGKYGVPVLDDGTKFEVSMRHWGSVMHHAHPKETDSYMDYYVMGEKFIPPYRDYDYVETHSVFQHDKEQESDEKEDLSPVEYLEMLHSKVVHIRATIYTNRLVLLHMLTNSYDKEFMDMLFKNKDLELFVGINSSQENIQGFKNYFIRPKSFYYAICLEEEPHKFIGYIGIDTSDGKYNLEFYIDKTYRNKGLGKEAVQGLCESLFRGEVFKDSGSILPEINYIYASTLSKNVACRRLLESCGFSDNRRPEESTPVILYNLFFEEEEIYSNEITEYWLWRD